MDKGKSIDDFFPSNVLYFQSVLKLACIGFKNQKKMNGIPEGVERGKGGKILGKSAKMSQGKAISAGEPLR